MMIIDSGIHVWLPEAPDRPWMPGRTAHLPEPLPHQKFSAMMGEAGVGHAVLVPPSWEGERVDYTRCCCATKFWSKSRRSWSSTRLRSWIFATKLPRSKRPRQRLMSPASKT